MVLSCVPKSKSSKSGSQANIDKIGWVVLSDTFMAPKLSGEAQLEGTCASKITILRSLWCLGLIISIFKPSLMKQSLFLQFQCDCMIFCDDARMLKTESMIVSVADSFKTNVS